MEIAQSEEVEAPEIELYNFLRKWAEKHKHSLSFMEVQNLFVHVRYATIPYPQLERIRKYGFNDHERLQNALSEVPDINKDKKIEIKQYTNRKRQEGQLLVNGASYKKWTTKLANASPPLYTVISEKRKGAVIITPILKESSGDTTTHSTTQLCFRIISLSKSHAKQNTSVRQVGGSKMEYKLRVSHGNTVVMRATPTGIHVEKHGAGRPETLKFTEPFPWLLTIDYTSSIFNWDNTITVQTV
jgi:hypothetical protein